MKFAKHISILFLLLATSIVTAQEQSESVLKAKFNKGVHLIAEVSDSKMNMNDSLTVTYKLYVAHDIGISNYNFPQAIENEDFEVKDLKLQNTKIEYELFNNERYRYVILKKLILKPKLKGKFRLDVLELDITAEIPTKKEDQFGRLRMEKVNRIIKTDNIIIDVI